MHLMTSGSNTGPVGAWPLGGSPSYPHRLCGHRPWRRTKTSITSRGQLQSPYTYRECVVVLCPGWIILRAPWLTQSIAVCLCLLVPIASVMVKCVLVLQCVHVHIGDKDYLKVSSWGCQSQSHNLLLNRHNDVLRCYNSLALCSMACSLQFKTEICVGIAYQ